MQYLHPKKYYEDLYDLHTINQCLDVIEFWRELYQKKDTDKDLKKIPTKEIEKGFNYFYSWQLRTTMGERYREREQTIIEWMDRDREKQERLDNAQPPKKIICKCGARMQPREYKHLADFDDKPLKVLFFYDCADCKSRKGVYDDGSERISKPFLCSQCNHEVKISYKKKGENSITTYFCPACKHKDTEVDDWEKRRKEREAQEKKDKELLKEFRAEFCLDEKEGQEYIELMEAITVANAVHDEEAAKYDDPAHQVVHQIQKLTVSELEERLSKAVGKASFEKLVLEKPELGQRLTIPFSVQDGNPKRTSQESRRELEEVISKKLNKTNWCLSKNSLLYRLGYLEGNLIGYESEEDLLKLAGKVAKKQPKSTLDPELRRKYAHHEFVQLARMTGEFKGIENVRKQRLKDEPEGFFLTGDEGIYTCMICGGQHPGSRIWWYLDGLKCADCRRNIKELKLEVRGGRYDDDSNWFADWQIKPHYGVHPATRGKLKREGSLVGHDFINPQGQNYFTIYLKSENQKFLKKYPKQPDQYKIEWAKDGKNLVIKENKHNNDK